MLLVLDRNASPEPATASSPLEDIAHLPDVQSILQVCARVTGMRYTVVAHVTDKRWLACAVLDEVDFGLPVGGELPIKTTLCDEVRAGRETIAFDHASADPRWRDHHTPKAYGLESYIAVPIILSDGEFFGTLCAIDPKPARASAPETVAMFELFAKLIAAQLEASRRLAVSEAALLDARETADLRDQFIAVLGHDLRNPLAAIDAGTALLAQPEPESRTDSILGEMRNSVRRMERLINDVLDFARGRLGGGLSLRRRHADDLPQMLAQVVEEVRAAHPHATILTSIEIASPVSGDPDRLAQLTSNLLANAVTHGDPRHPVRLDVRAGDRLFELSVANHGQPIPDHIRPRLFQPFNRKGSGEVREGLGLGLYICSQIAAAHGGSLNVTSDERETRFDFRMPLPASAKPAQTLQAVG
ncbi:GAF domain-containing sensor histidine kinase [Phenylobacterium deserti]|uniref:GAF domain-containing sensor histidine kinase n=1 Tax=Phenylobacterium deserti TaxID=1914756 RepID=UPI00197C8544|nr:GAF domain-containing sensor histidine kinase [Phenylobacterium deserti]